MTRAEAHHIKTHRAQIDGLRVAPRRIRLGPADRIETLLCRLSREGRVIERDEAWRIAKLCAKKFSSGNSTMRAFRFLQVPAFIGDEPTCLSGRYYRGEFRSDQFRSSRELFDEAR